MKVVRSMALCLLLAATCGAVTEDAVDPSQFEMTAARNATETYNGALAKYLKYYNEKCNVARKACIAQLTTAQAVATKANKLDEAVKIRDAIAKLSGEVQDSGVGGTHAAGVSGDRAKLASALVNTVWQTGESKLRFNDDGTGIFLEGAKPDPAKSAWTWAALTGREVIVRYSSGWTNRMEFDDAFKTYAIHDSANGKKLDVPGGKRVS